MLPAAGGDGNRLATGRSPVLTEAARGDAK